MDFIPNQQLNVRWLLWLILPILNIFLNTMFIFYEASTFWEYTNVIFIALKNGVDLLLFAVLIIQAWRVFEIIDFGQTFFDYSK